MRFLVFNIVVLLSLGYLLTGQKDQSLGNWLDALPDKITTSYHTGDLTALLTDDKNAKGARQPSPNAAKMQHQKVPPAVAEPEVTADALRELVQQTVKKSVARQMKHSNEAAETTVLVDNSEQLVNSVEASLPNKADMAPQQPAIAPDDADLAQAFAEFDKTSDIGGAEEGVNSEAGNAIAMTAKANPDKPEFMTPQERRLALSDFIQQVQLVSLERGGF
jgi:hypothetical protein